MKSGILLASLVLAGCVSLPSGPSARVMPAPNKPFAVFVRDDDQCRGYAARQVGTEPQQAAVNSGVTSAAVGTVVGAAAGALIDGGHGAGVGAASGLLIGSAAGSGAANATSWELQRRYDIAYEQCMYAAGNQVPGYRRPGSYPPPRDYYPPPPPG
jgi:OmpA family protein